MNGDTMPILFLAGSDQVALRFNSSSGTHLTHAIDGSAAGTGEWHNSPDNPLGMEPMGTPCGNG